MSGMLTCLMYVLNFYTQFLLMILIVAKWIKSVTEKAISSITDVNLYLV